MLDESLEKTTDIVIKDIEQSEIPLYDKIELMLNLKLFLEDYKNNIKILKKETKR